MDGVLVELMNSRYEPLSVDVLAGAGAGGWLTGQGASTPRASPGALDRLCTLREALRVLALGNNGVPLHDAALTAAGDALVGLTFRVELGLDGSEPRLAAAAVTGRSSAGDGAAELLAFAVTAYLAERATGRWGQVKACPAPGCGYAFRDRSRNGSRRWCTMAGCGNRAKNHAWRARQAPGVGSA